MAGVHDRLVGKPEQDPANGLQQGRQVPTRKIRSSNRSLEQRVADEQRALGLAIAPDRKAHATGAVSWGVMDPRAVATEAPRTFSVIENIDGRLWVDIEAEHVPLMYDPCVEEIVGVM